MTFLIPLGLLALLSVAALIIIYIIKANYQQQHISSTYVWALSLKLKKKRLPVSKLRNILLIVCQVLFLAACSFAVAQPSLITRAAVTEREVIAVIDSSASMRAGLDGETRFSRAVEQVSQLSEEVFGQGGYVSIFVAGPEPTVLAERVTNSSAQLVRDKLSGLLTSDECSYGTSDVNAAMRLCENVIRENANAELYLYTDTQYSYIPSKVKVVDVAEDGEWNAGILNAYTVVEDNYYSLFVEVASYGRDGNVSLRAQVHDVNAEEQEGDTSRTVELSAQVPCRQDKTVTVIFRSGNLKPEDYELNDENIFFVAIEQGDRFYSYSDINIVLDGGDSFTQDDSFSIYDGKKEVLKVQYSSPTPNNFVNGILGAMANYYRTEKNVWDVQITEVHSDPATEGFDLYIFEHAMPDVMPTDGVVILWDLDKAPEGSGLTLGDVVDVSAGGTQLYLTQESDDPLLENVSADKIYVTRYTTFLNYDPAMYEVLLSCDRQPMLLAQNSGNRKVLVLPFSVHYSNFAMRFKDISALFYNLFEQWIPCTVVGNAFSVYEDVTLNARGQQLTVSNTYTGESEVVLNEFPATLRLDVPGTYSLVQTTDFGEQIEQRIYAKIPSAESNIFAQADSFRNPFLVESLGNEYKSLIFYIAIALCALAFVEWILHSREYL